jgi:hypothetical protein
MGSVKNYVATVRADRARVLSELTTIRKQVADLVEHIGVVRSGWGPGVAAAPPSGSVTVQPPVVGTVTSPRPFVGSTVAPIPVAGTAIVPNPAIPGPATTTAPSQNIVGATAPSTPIIDDQSSLWLAHDSLLTSAVSRVNLLLSEVDVVIARYPGIVEAPDGA